MTQTQTIALGKAEVKSFFRCAKSWKARQGASAQLGPHGQNREHESGQEGILERGGNEMLAGDRAPLCPA